MSLSIPLARRVQHADFRVLNHGSALYVASSLVHYGLRVLLRKRRTRSYAAIDAEYNATARGEYWRPNISLDDLVLGNSVTPRWVLRDNRPVLGTEREARAYILERLGHWVRKLLPAKTGSVIEFGCGTGRNLMFLAREFAALRLSGIELTPTTAKRAQEMVTQAGLGITIKAGDICGDLHGLSSANLAFSIHALEQLPRSFPRAIDNMLRVAPVLVLFEPVHELWPRSTLSLASRLRLRSADYLDGLYPYLRQRSDITIQHMEPMPTALHALNRAVELVITRRDHQPPRTT